MSTDSFVQVAPDGGGKKVATEEFVRSDGTTVEEQVVLLADPKTGAAQDSPPWAGILALLELILVEQRVQTMMMRDEFTASDHEIESLRDEVMRELR